MNLDFLSSGEMCANILQIAKILNITAVYFTLYFCQNPTLFLITLFILWNKYLF